MQRFTGEVGRIAIQKRHEDAEIFAKMAYGLFEGHAEHAFDDHLMRQADTKGETAVGNLLQRARLGRQHRGVTRIGRNHCGTQADLRHLARNNSERSQCVEAKDLRHPIGPETRVGEKSTVFNCLIDGFGLAKDSNFHDDS